MYMWDCQNYGPFWGPYYNTGPNMAPNLGDPKRDHNFDNPPHVYLQAHMLRGYVDSMEYHACASWTALKIIICPILRPAGAIAEMPTKKPVASQHITTIMASSFTSATLSIVAKISGTAGINLCHFLLRTFGISESWMRGQAELKMSDSHQSSHVPQVLMWGSKHTTTIFKNSRL